MKACVDCKHCVEPGEFAQCHAPKNMKADVVTGTQQPLWKYCNTVRLERFPFDILFNSCGKRGRWWEAK